MTDNPTLDCTNIIAHIRANPGKWGPSIGRGIRCEELRIALFPISYSTDNAPQVLVTAKGKRGTFFEPPEEQCTEIQELIALYQNPKTSAEEAQEIITRLGK